jgi:hypothetical protein
LGRLCGASSFVIGYLLAAYLFETLRPPSVSRPFSSWNRPILTEIYLCHACSCQEILRVKTAGQDLALDDYTSKDAQCLLCTTYMCTLAWVYSPPPAEPAHATNPAPKRAVSAPHPALPHAARPAPAVLCRQE